jgi:hypothetical protein
MVDEGNALAKHGCCFESTMPYNRSNCGVEPSSTAVAEAANYKCNPNQTSIAIADFQTAIYNSQQTPLLGSLRMGWPVPESAMNAVTNGGFVPPPADNESILGGHSEEGAIYAMKQGPNDPAPRLYVGFIQTWGSCGDMTAGISTFWFQYPEFFNSTWVQNNGGIDARQQADLGASPPPPPPPPPGEIVLSATPTTIVNDGSTTETSQITGTTSGDSIEVDVITPTDEVFFLAGGTATGTTLVLTGTLVASYIGPAVVQAFDHTAIPNLASNQVPVTIAAPSPCKLGNKACRMLNAVPVWPIRRFPFLRARRGRFYYLNP